MKKFILAALILTVVVSFAFSYEIENIVDANGLVTDVVIIDTVTLPTPIPPTVTAVIKLYIEPSSTNISAACSLENRGIGLLGTNEIFPGGYDRDEDVFVSWLVNGATFIQKVYVRNLPTTGEAGFKMAAW